MVLKVVKGREFDRNVITRIKENIENGCPRMGEDVAVDVQIVKEIPREGSGKRKVVISLAEGYYVLSILKWLSCL